MLSAAEARTMSQTSAARISHFDIARIESVIHRAVEQKMGHVTLFLDYYLDKPHASYARLMMDHLRLHGYRVESIDGNTATIVWDETNLKGRAL